MERGNTKQEILEASLELFSAHGFEVTSISQIANAVGIRKASRYSHFGGKLAILDIFPCGLTSVIGSWNGRRMPWHLQKNISGSFSRSIRSGNKERILNGKLL